MIQDDASSNSEATQKVVVYLGDYIDRGLESRTVIDLLLDDPLAGFEVVHLKGNHEDALLRFMDDASFGPDWFAIGGDATALSYGVHIPSGLTSTARFEHIREELSVRIPERHFAFFTSLELMHRADDYVLVHAGIRPGVPLDEQDPNDLLRAEGSRGQGERAHGGTSAQHRDAAGLAGPRIPAFVRTPSGRSLPFFGRRFYMVILMGWEHRSADRISDFHPKPSPLSFRQCGPYRPVLRLHPDLGLGDTVCG